MHTQLVDHIAQSTNIELAITRIVLALRALEMDPTTFSEAYVETLADCVEHRVAGLLNPPRP